MTRRVGAVDIGTNSTRLLVADVSAEGGIADSQMVGDTEGAVQWMRAQPENNGKVGLIGSCSGGRHAFIYACQKKDIDACVEQWGGRVVMSKEELNAKTPTAPIEMTKELGCPLLGLFGNDDRAPSPEQVNQHEAELKKLGKNYSFHRYDGAGHAFFNAARVAGSLGQRVAVQERERRLGRIVGAPRALHQDLHGHLQSCITSGSAPRA